MPLNVEGLFPLPRVLKPECDRHGHATKEPTSVCAWWWPRWGGGSIIAHMFVDSYVAVLSGGECT